MLFRSEAFHLNKIPFLSAILLTSLWKGNLGIAAVGCFMNRLISHRTEECSAKHLSLGCTLDNRDGVVGFLNLEAFRLTILFPIDDGPALSFGLVVCLTLYALHRPSENANRRRKLSTSIEHYKQFIIMREEVAKKAICSFSLYDASIQHNAR